MKLNLHVDGFYCKLERFSNRFTTRAAITVLSVDEEIIASEGILHTKCDISVKLALTRTTLELLYGA